MADVSDPGVSAELAARQARRLGFWARVVLVPVAAIGAVLSFRSLYQAAVPTFGDYLATGFPLLVDLLILGASLQYVAGAKVGRPMAGWRLTAHAGVAGTLVLNALAAKELGEVPWHVTAPAVWAVLVELTAKQVLGEWKATHTAKADVISLPLWMTAPVESVRTRLLMFRTGITNAHQARIAVGVNAAAREALRLALPKRNARRVRKIINRQLRAGSLTPVAILRPLGWTKGGVVLNNARPDVILKAVLQEVLDPGSPPAPVAMAPVPARAPVPTQAPVPAEPEFAAEPEPQVVGQRPAAQAPRPSQYPEAPQYPAPPGQPGATPQYPTPQYAGPQYAGTAEPYPGAVPQYSVPTPQRGVPQYPGVGQYPAETPKRGVPQYAAAPQPGTVQQPARALQLGRALHRGRVLQQTGSTDSSATTAEQLRMELVREQSPQGDQPVQEFGAERPTRPVEPFVAPTAVLGLNDSRQTGGRTGVGVVDETEILEDMEHLDELDGQGYPDEFDGYDDGGYIDLDDPSQQAPVSRS